MSWYLRLRASFLLEVTNRRTISPTHAAVSPTWRYRLRAARTLCTQGVPETTLSDSLFSLILCEIQYSKYSLYYTERERDCVLRALTLSFLLLFVGKLGQFKIASYRDAKDIGASTGGIIARYAIGENRSISALPGALFTFCENFPIRQVSKSSKHLVKSTKNSET